MEWIDNFVFLLLISGATFLFIKNISRIKKNISLGRALNIDDHKKERWKLMAKVAIGQSKMVVRPTAGIFHIILYAGFIIINIEVFEIIIDGIFGTHRILSFLGSFYYLLIAIFEYLALAVIIACVVFLLRRNVLKLKRFLSNDLNGWPKSDANIILITEILLMSAFLLMNAADGLMMSYGSLNSNLVHPEFTDAAIKIFGNQTGNLYFPVSAYLTGFLPTQINSLHFIERSAWWFHIIGILGFLNYLPYSKHFHILMAFPTVFYSNLKAKGQFTNLESVTKEVKLILDPSAPAPTDEAPSKFGAKDISDLTWKQLLDAYSCTECGRCTSNCPANQTGKLLSPRKIMMDTRDRMEEIGKNIAQHGKDFTDNKSLIGDYITTEELWACTTCNACTESCPINIDPLSIIIDLRRYLVMEKSEAPASLNSMFTNIENNGAPWQFSMSDRLNWTKEN